MVYSAGDVVFKGGLFDPGVTAEEFSKRTEEEARRSKLTPEQRQKEMEEVVTRLREEEFDEFDGAEEEWLSPVSDRARVTEFVHLGRSKLRELKGFTSDGDSLVEDIASRYVQCSSERNELRGIYGIMTAWDPMRMQHEGRPPYSMSFAPGFAESLEDVLEDEGESGADVSRWMERMSEPREYRMSARDIVLARAGVSRGLRSGVISAEVARALVGQLDCWAG